jgi:hypothetical protein
MQAVTDGGIRALVVNASYPDAVNVVLGRLGLAPTCGSGNLDLLVPRIRRIVAEWKQVPVQEVHVALVAHRATVASVLEQGQPGTPYLLRIAVGTSDLTREIDHQSLFSEVRDRFSLPAGPVGYPVAASSAVRVILALLGDTGQYGHAPGPNGLPGGYPVRFRSVGTDVLELPGVSLGDMIDLNIRGQRIDGIEKIQSDGSVIFTEKARQIMKALLGYECGLLRISELFDRATELESRLETPLRRPSGGIADKADLDPG